MYLRGRDWTIAKLLLASLDLSVRNGAGIAVIFELTTGNFSSLAPLRSNCCFTSAASLGHKLQNARFQPKVAPVVTATISTSKRTAAETAARRGTVVASAHLDLDGAWTGTGTDALATLPTVDARSWGPRLRFSALRHEIEAFYQHIDLPLGDARFLVYGSGDFHHLTALWLRRVFTRSLTQRRATVVSFDNHPDWDIRPPAWCCGSWINRALALPGVETISIWGLGSFESWGWHRLVGNQRDTRRGRLTVQAWADARSVADRTRTHAILRENWREKFTGFAATLQGKQTYVTIDLDCLREGEAVTNWENGFFTADDVRWALRELRAHGAEIVAGDLCGAWSPQGYARWKQCFAATMDHPNFPDPDPAAALATNLRAFRTLWPTLAGGDEHDADGDE